MMSIENQLDRIEKKLDHQHEMIHDMARLLVTIAINTNPDPQGEVFKEALQLRHKAEALKTALASAPQLPPSKG